MDYEIFNKAMIDRKTVNGNINCREQLYKITAISIAMAIVQQQIWIPYKEEYVTLNNVMTWMEAYEITEVIEANWTINNEF